MDERKSVYAVVDDEQMSRVRGALEDVTSLVDSLRLGCEIAYRREPTQAEGDAHEYRHDQSMGASYGANECFVPMGGHHGWKCNCGTWVWGGPTVCQRCVDRETVKVALEWKGELERMRAFVRRTATDGGSIVSSASMTPAQIAIARAAGRMLVMPDGYGFVYVPGPRFCACGRPESDCDQSCAACPQKTVEIHVSRPMWLTLYTPSGQCVTLTPEPGRCLDQARIVSEVASGVRLLVPGTGGEIWTWGVVR